MSTGVSGLNVEAFRVAQFATLHGLYTACRSLSGFWRTESGSVKSDQDMVDAGWVPMESLTPVVAASLSEAS